MGKRLKRCPRTTRSKRKASGSCGDVAIAGNSAEGVPLEGVEAGTCRGRAGPSKRRRIPGEAKKDTTKQRHYRKREAKRIMADEVAIRVRTVTASMDKLMVKMPTLLRTATVDILTNQSKGKGYLMPIFSTFMNHAINISIEGDNAVPDNGNLPANAQLPHDSQLIEDLCNQNFHRQVICFFVGRTTSKLPDSFKNFLRTYISQHPINPHAQALINEMDSVVIDYMAIEWFTSFKNNIILNYETRFIRMFYDFYRPGLNQNIKKRDIWNIAKNAYKLCSEIQDPAVIIDAMNTYMSQFAWFTLNDESGDESTDDNDSMGNTGDDDDDNAVDLDSNGSADFMSEDNGDGGDDPQEDAVDLDSNGSADFMSEDNARMDEEESDGNGQVDNIDADEWPQEQPENSEYYSGLNADAVNHFHAVSYGSNTVREYESAKAKLLHYIPRMKKVRQISSSLALPGYRPRLFSLAPKCKWKRRYISINNRNALTFMRQARNEIGMNRAQPGDNGKQKTLKGLGFIFDFYGSSGNHWTEETRPPQTSNNHMKKRRNEKVLLKGRCKRRGLPQLRPDEWATALNLTDEQAADPSKRLPTMVDLVQSNGIECKVMMSRLVYKTPTPEQASTPLRPRGTENLAEAGFHHLQEVCDIRTDKNGVFGDILKLEPLPDNVRAYGIDPGQKELISVTAENLTATDDAFELAGDDRTYFVE